MCESGFFSGKNRVMLVIRTNFAGTVFLEIQLFDFQKTVLAKLVRITIMTLFFPEIKPDDSHIWHKAGSSIEIGG